ncbi:MAG: mucoidy inhibitor MuiA family protein [Myxococcaceae bacterium]
MYSLVLISVLSASQVSAVSQVVVYPDRAQVTRSMSIACGNRATALFEGIPPAADPASFRAKTDEGVVEGLRGEERTRRDAFAQKRKELEDQAKTLQEQLNGFGQAKVRAQREDANAQLYGNVATELISREMTTEPKPDTKSWSTALDLSTNTRLKSVADNVDEDAKIRETNEKLEDVNRQLSELDQAADRKEFIAEVRVSCASGKNAKVLLTYMVGGASWSPAYEARTEESSNQVELSTYATVKQGTGEDWKDTAIILSTAVPNENATPPELQPLNVNVQEREPPKKVLVAREEMVERADTLSGASTPPSGGDGRMRASSQGLSVQLSVPERGDVPGNNQSVRLFVGKQKLKASFALKSIPKRLPFVFRTAEATNSAPYPLLAGPLDAFRHNGFIARYNIERTPMGGLLKLSFGIDEQVRIKRTTVEEVKRDIGLFGGKKRFRYAYKLELANFSKETQTVEVSEQVPVSELDDVLVEMDPKSTAGFELGKDDGIATWKLSMKPGDKKQVDVAFHVDVPSSYDTGNL